VRTLEGIVTSQAGDWPDGVSVLFEIRPRADASKGPKGVRADRRGYFKMSGVPAGEYCFKATAEGWQSVTGVIVVSPTADPASRVNFQMLLGV